MTTLKKYDDLNETTKQEVRRRYVMWRYDTTSRTFDEWAEKHSFYVRDDGRLDERHRHCEPAFMADVEE